MYMSSQSLGKLALWIIGLLAAIVVSLLLTYWLTLGIADRIPPNTVGQLNEATTIVGTAFSFLAFLGLLATLLMQRQELALQRDELRQSREEYAKMAESQNLTERNLFFASYLSALESESRATSLADTEDPLEQVRLHFRRAAAERTISTICTMLSREQLRHVPTAGIEHSFTDANKSESERTAEAIFKPIEAQLQTLRNFVINSDAIDYDTLGECFEEINNHLELISAECPASAGTGICRRLG